MDETVGDISFDRGEEGPSEDSEAVTDQEVESSNRHNEDDSTAPGNIDTLLKDSPYDDSHKQSQKITAPGDQDQKDDSNYNDANKDVTNDHDAQDGANFQDNQDNSDDQDGSCSSDENSNQDTSCSDNFSNAEGEFQAAGDNHDDLADREKRGLHNQHHPSYPVDLATFPDDQAVDYSAAFPSNRLTNNSSSTATAILPETNMTAQSSEPDNVGSKGPCHLVKSFSDFPGFSACLAKNAKQQSETIRTPSLNVIAKSTDVPQSSSGFNNILQQHRDSSLEKTASAENTANEGEILHSAPPSLHEVSSIPSSNASTPPVTKNSETCKAMDGEPIPTPVAQYAFRQLRSRSVALQPSLAMKPRQARGRRRTTSNTNPLNREGHCRSLPPVSFSVPTASGSEATSISVDFSNQDIRPRSASPSCFSLPVDPQEFPRDRLPSPQQVDTTTTGINCTLNLNSQASILSEDSSKPTRNEESSSADGEARLPTHITPSVSAVSDVSAQCASPSASISSNDGPVGASAAAAVTESTSYLNNSLPAQDVLPCQQGSGASKPELSFGRDVINLVPDENSRCESSETTDESSFPKRKKRMKLKATKKRICKYFSDSSDEDDNQSNVQPATSLETVADQCELNSASSSHFTNNPSVNCSSLIQKDAAKYNALSESSSSDLEMQVDTGAESEVGVELSNTEASNQKRSSSNVATDHPNDVCKDTSQNRISEEYTNVLIDDSLPAVESEVTVESSLIETVLQTTPLIHQRRSSRISSTEEPSALPNTDLGPTSNKHAKSIAEREGKQSRRRFKRTKTRLEQHEDAQITATKEESESAGQSASNTVLAAAPPSTSTLASTQSAEEDSTQDELPDIDATLQQAPSSAHQDLVSDTPAVTVTAETESTDAATSSTGECNEQRQLVTKDLLLWKRRLAKYEQLLCENENMTTDTDDSSSCSAQRQVWLGMRDYYRAKIESVNNCAAAAAAAPLDGASSSTVCLQLSDSGNRAKKLGKSPFTSTKPWKKKKHWSGSSDRRRRDSAPEDQTRLIQQSSVSSTAAASAQQSDDLPADEKDEQRATSDEAKLPFLNGNSARNGVVAGPSGRGVDDDDAVIVDSDDDDDDGNRADEGAYSSSSRKGGSWRDREWLSLRKRPKHVYRKRRGANKGGADADVVDLTNEVESDPDDGDVEVLQHDKPVVYLKTENRRKRRRAARMCAQEGSSVSNAAAAQTIDISNNDATPPPPPVDMNDPNILFGMLLDLPKGYQLPLAPSKDEEEERGGGGSSNIDGERAARLCQPSGPDLLEAVCMAQESKHPAGGVGSTQAGCSRDATLAGGSSYGPRWGAASTTTSPAFESTSGGYSGATSTSGGSGGHYSGASGDFGFGAGPSTASSGGGGGGRVGGGKLSEKAMHMEKLWEHLNVPAEDIPQCRLRQSVVDLEVPSNFDYDCTNSPPYPSQFASGAGGHGPNSGAGPSSGSDRQSFASSQYGEVDKFEPESRATRRRNFAYQPGTSINLAGASSVVSNGGGASDSNSSALNLLPCNNPFRHSHRLRNTGFLGESSASNPLPEGPSDRLGASTSQANEALDDQGSSSSSSSGNVGHNRSEPVPKLHLIRRSQLWESSSTTPTTSGSGGTPMFNRSQSTPIHVSSPLDLSSIPGPSLRRGVFAPPGSLNQEAGPSSFGGSTGQLMGDPFSSSFVYNPRHPHGLFGRPYLERVDEEVRNAAAVASILPLSSNNATSRASGNRQSSFDPPNNNSGRSMTEYFWLPHLHSEDMPSRNANYNVSSGSGLNNENGRAATGSSGSNNSRNNNSDVQFLAANLPDSLMDDGTDDEVMASNVAVHVPTHISSRGSNPSTSDGAQRGGGHRAGADYRGPPSFDEPQPSGSSHTPLNDQPSTSSGGGDCGNNMEISCPICLDTLTEIKAGPSHLVSTVCGHLFCNGCLEPAVRRTKQCPTCRRKLTKKQYHKVYL